VHARLHAQQPAWCAAGRAARPARAALALPGTPPAHALCVNGVSVLQGARRLSAPPHGPALCL